MTPTDQVASKLLEIINQVQSTVTNHGADAVNLVLTSTRIDGISWLVGTFIVFILSLLSAAFMIKIKEKYDNTEILIFFLLVMVLVLFLSLVYPWNWIQAINPKLYLAHEIIQKVIQ